MASPDESAGTEKRFSEAQLKAMAGVFQGLLHKALTDRAQGGTSSEREENAERDPPGEMVQGGVAGAGDGQRVRVRKYIVLQSKRGKPRGCSLLEISYASG